MNSKKVSDNYPNIDFHDGLPELTVCDGKSRTLLVLNDLMTSAGDSVIDLFTKISHINISVEYLTQDIFYKYKQ